ncbi:MAG TPA: calcium-binding protein [Allosphingosinicella sp.]|jgi:Ca2+-binding RTX toxin-like protein
MTILSVGAAGYSTIQSAVDAAADGDTIVVDAGIYVEQVVVTGRSGLTIRAADGAQVTIQAPADLHETGRSSSDREIHSVFAALNSTDIVLQNIDIDGRGAGASVDEGGGAGTANFYGIFYRNSSGALTDVDVTGVRDAYPGGLTVGGQPLVDGVQRGIAVVVDNDSMLAFAMHGGTIDDFQKQAGLFSRADLDVSGVTVIGGGAQTVIAQNGFQIQRSTGSVSGNTMTGIGYAGPANAYSGVILAPSNMDLAITGNVIGGSNVDSAAAKVVGIWIYVNSVATSGGLISGNTITHADVGIAVDNAVTPNALLIENNAISDGDLTDPFSAGVRFEPMPVTTLTAFDIDGSAMADKLSGNAGNDILSGLAGDDLLRGNAGNDSLDGGTGADSMTGGAGDDLYFVDDIGDAAIEAAGEGADEVRTPLPVYVLPEHVETLKGTRAGSQDLRGNAGDNIVTSENGAHTDIFRMQDGGNDSASGFGGRDIFYFGSAFTADDAVDGGGNADIVGLQGDYSGGVSIGSITNLGNLGSISLFSSTNNAYGGADATLNSYALVAADANVAAGEVLKVNGTSLAAGESFAFDGSLETDGRFWMYGGKGTDTLTGGDQGDFFIFAHDGRFAAGDTVNGGGGYDVVLLRGDYVLDFNGVGFDGALSSVESLTVLSYSDTQYAGGGDGEFDYQIRWADALLGAGQTITINGSRLTANESLAFDGSLETDGIFRVFGGAGSDAIDTGSGADLIAGGLGSDRLNGGAGGDAFRYYQSDESTLGAPDEIEHFETGADRVDLSRIDANEHTAGDDAFRYIGTSSFSAQGAGSAGELRIVAGPGPGEWAVEGDTDGDGTADLYIQFTSTPMLASTDFFL